MNPALYIVYYIAHLEFISIHHTNPNPNPNLCGKIIITSPICENSNEQIMCKNHVKKIVGKRT